MLVGFGARDFVNIHHKMEIVLEPIHPVISCAIQLALAVHCGEFHGNSLELSQEISSSFETSDSPMELEERLKLQQEPLEHGSTIIYVPTRKETLAIAKFLCDFGIKAAAYNAKVSLCINYNSMVSLWCHSFLKLLHISCVSITRFFTRLFLNLFTKRFESRG